MKSMAAAITEAELKAPLVGLPRLQREQPQLLVRRIPGRVFQRPVPRGRVRSEGVPRTGRARCSEPLVTRPLPNTILTFL